MASSNRKLIYDNVKAQLETIDVANTPDGSSTTYPITVQTVVWKKDTTEEVRASDTPQIQIWKLPAQYEDRSARQLFEFLNFDLFLVVDAVDEDAADEQIDQLRDSVIACLYADVTRGVHPDSPADNSGRNAFSTRLVDDFEGVDENPRVGQLRMRWQVKTHREVTLS